MIGGGVNGVATLRELALNGIACVLLDTGDFCGGASGASSRMAHGGLRYLEGREFRLVAESALERDRLITHADHLVRPLEIVVPLKHVFRGFRRAVMRFLGMTRRSGPLSLLALEGALYLYEIFGHREHSLPRHKTSLRRGDFPAGLDQQVCAVTRYFDGQISHPEGLVLEMLSEALEAGNYIAALNHVLWSFDGTAFTAQDRFGTGLHVLKPRLVINAGGAWIDRVNAGLGCSTHYVRGVKGAHLVLHNAALGRRMNNKAFYFDDGVGRMVIALPIGDNILLGTTEVETRNPDDGAISGQEIDYLINAINGLFSDITVDRQHIISMTTGIRPLRNVGCSSTTSAARDHALEENRIPGANMPLLSLVGGKWTTFRAFSEQAADRAFALLGRSRRISTTDRNYPGAGQCTANEIAAIGQLPLARAETLLRRYGVLAREVARSCANKGDRPLIGAPTYSRAEIEWLIHARAACTIEDIILRRTRLASAHEIQHETLAEVGEILIASIKRDQNDISAEIHKALADPRIMGARARCMGAGR